MVSRVACDRQPQPDARQQRAHERGSKVLGSTQHSAQRTRASGLQVSAGVSTDCTALCPSSPEHLQVSPGISRMPVQPRSRDTAQDRREERGRGETRRGEKEETKREERGERGQRRVKRRVKRRGQGRSALPRRVLTHQGGPCFRDTARHPPFTLICRPEIDL
eukprot:1152543-Rhodomonas_salina.1